MSSSVSRLAQWARDLHADALPASVRERALLQHLSVAGACAAVGEHPTVKAYARAGSRSGSARQIGGGSGSRRDAARLHAGMSALLEYDDYLFFGHTGHGVVPAAWAFARGHDLDTILAATVAGNEVGGRVGASLLLGPTPGQSCAVVSAVAAATTAGLLAGLDAHRLAHALALALAAPPTLTGLTLRSANGRIQVGSVPVAHGIDAVDLAGAGVEGPLDILDERDGLHARMCWVPLRAAFTGLGKAWLTETIGFKLHPVADAAQVPVQAFSEVLKRHVRAADKRLRADQIDRIEIVAGLPTWAAEQAAGSNPILNGVGVSQSLRWSIGVLALGHALTPARLNDSWLAARAEGIGEVVRRIELRHDWSTTLMMADHLVDAAAPLLAGLTVDELLSIPRRARESFGAGPDRMAAADLLQLVRLRPDRLAERILHASGDLADADLTGWQFRFDTELVVHTSRGGRWPERRSLPEGSPGWSWHKTIQAVLSKYSGNIVELDQPVPADDGGRELLAATGSADGEAWVEALMDGAGRAGAAAALAAAG
jgi:2-methylcitrate dehydratase PrpD